MINEKKKRKKIKKRGRVVFVINEKKKKKKKRGPVVLVINEKKKRKKKKKEGESSL